MHGEPFLPGRARQPARPNLRGGLGWGPRRRWWRHGSRRILLVLVPLSLAGVAAGCGGARSPGVANLGTTAATTTPAFAAGASASQQGSPLQGAIRFAECMRSHGVPNFPQPTAIPGGVRIAIVAGKGVNPHSSQFGRAQTSCRKFAPEAAGGASGGLQGQALAQFVAHRLTFAACMRKHGIANFPDPDSQGDFHLEGTGISQYSQTDMTAARTCLPAAAGSIQLPSASREGQGQAGG